MTSSAMELGSGGSDDDDDGDKSEVVAGEGEGRNDCCGSADDADEGVLLLRRVDRGGGTAKTEEDRD